MTDTRTLTEARDAAWEAYRKIRHNVLYQPEGIERALFTWAYNAGHVRASSLNSMTAYEEGYKKGREDEKAEHEDAQWNREIYDSLNREAQRVVDRKAQQQ